MCKKLQNLNVGSRSIIDRTVFRIWGRETKHYAEFPSKTVAKKLVLSTSSSGARDCMGISLKHVKTFFRFSKLGWDMYYEITKAVAFTGYIPKSWKIDEISFLYKKKGKKEDPKNWRPITIAPSRLLVGT